MSLKCRNCSGLLWNYLHWPQFMWITFWIFLNVLCDFCFLKKCYLHYFKQSPQGPHFRKCSTAGCTKQGRQSVSTPLLRKWSCCVFIVHSDKNLQNIMYTISFEVSSTFFAMVSSISTCTPYWHADYCNPTPGPEAKGDSLFVRRAAH